MTPEIVDAQTAYQNGLVDYMQDRESLITVLNQAGEVDLAIAYTEGWLAGANLRYPGQQGGGPYAAS